MKGAALICMAMAVAHAGQPAVAPLQAPAVHIAQAVAPAGLQQAIPKKMDEAMAQSLLPKQTKIDQETPKQGTAESTKAEPGVQDQLPVKQAAAAVGISRPMTFVWRSL